MARDAIPAHRGNRTFTDRLVGVLRLETDVFREIRDDRAATVQAALVVIVSGLAGAVGGAGEGGRGLIGGALAALLGWAFSAAIIYFIGTQIMPGKRTAATPGDVLRCVGFAAIPGLLLVIAFLPLLGWVVAFVAWVWSVLTLIIATRVSLTISLPRAVLIAILARLVYAIVTFIIGLILNITLWGFGLFT